MAAAPIACGLRLCIVNDGSVYHVIEKGSSVLLLLLLLRHAQLFFDTAKKNLDFFLPKGQKKPWPKAKALLRS